MKRLFTALVIFGCGMFTPISASAADNDTCAVYGNLGSALVEFMLPLTLQEFVDIMTGKAPELEAQMGAELIKGISRKNLVTMMSLPADEIEVLGEAAGEVSVSLLMEGAASSPDEVNEQMVATCLKIGAQTIIDNQKRANAASAQNFGQ